CTRAWSLAAAAQAGQVGGHCRACPSLLVRASVSQKSDFSLCKRCTMSDNVAAVASASAPVSDPLYDRIAAKVEKKRFPGGVPTTVPLQGVDEAIDAMAAEVDGYV